jgi:hypothetical protein
MTNCQLLMTNQARMTRIEDPERRTGSRPMSDCRLQNAEFRLAEVQAGSGRRPRLARTEAATGVRHGKDANLVAERR